MVRELLISIYLLFFRIVFTIFNVLPAKRKITFVVSFKQNSLYVYEELNRQPDPFQMVFICTPASYSQMVKEVGKKKVLLFHLKKPLQFIRSVYHLATSAYVIVDNYYGFLAAAHFKKGVTCIQLWHAAGAIKTFGLKDKTINKRSHNARKRFKKVYSQFDYVVIGSEKMKHIFMDAFETPAEKFLSTGVPRTDLFFAENTKHRVMEKIYHQFPALREKKVILYAPTFRDGQLDEFKMALDLHQLHQELKDKYAFIFKLHPAIKKRMDVSRYADFIFDCSQYEDVNELLLVTDFLITDYSSIPFEFSILNRPMIFYPYDLKTYQKTRGFWEPYDELVPGPIAYDTGEIIDLIKNYSFDNNKIKAFANDWNTYSKGHSSSDLAHYIHRKEKIKSSMQRSME